MRKTEDKERTLTVEADKVKEEKSLKVAEGKCWKRVWMKVLKKTGDHLQDVPFKKQFDFAFKGKICFPFHDRSYLTIFSSETLILPIITLLLIVAYSVVAIYFYNMDG